MRVVRQAAYEWTDDEMAEIERRAAEACAAYLRDHPEWRFGELSAERSYTVALFRAAAEVRQEQRRAYHREVQRTRRAITTQRRTSRKQSYEKRRAIQRTKHWLDYHLEDLYAAASGALQGKVDEEAVRAAWQKFLWARRRWEAACQSLERRQWHG